MKFKIRLSVLLFSATLVGGCTANGQPLVVAEGGKSGYTIVLPHDARKAEERAAQLLQKHLQAATGAKLPIIRDAGNLGQGARINIGETTRAKVIDKSGLKPEGYLIQAEGGDLFIAGGSGKGPVYGVYRFLEDFAGAQKLDASPVVYAKNRRVEVPGHTRILSNPAFQYRQAYYPQSNDAEYLEWHGLHKLDDLWGLWGHSFDKLLPAAKHFAAHPEYYAFTAGKRRPTQLCLSNDTVINLVSKELKARIADNPDAMYWSISQNDDNGWCQCPRCAATDAAEGGPQGSLIKFVNTIAERFPEQSFTTLAYTYSSHPTKTLRPAANVYVMLSSIDAYRDKPLAEEGTAKGFVSDLKGWSRMTPNIFIWDYTTQFTAYLAPFPNLGVLSADFKFFRDNGVKGIFEQGPGDTYGELAELRSALVGALLWNADTDVPAFIEKYIANYYGPAAPMVKQYIDRLQSERAASKRKLDIYGNPVNEWKTWLRPEVLDALSSVLDVADAKVEGNGNFTARMRRVRLSLDYVVLQQSRFYGLEKFGCFVQGPDGHYAPREGFTHKINDFVAAAKAAGVTELSEGGLSPDTYAAEWASIFASNFSANKARDAAVKLDAPAVEDYPAKGPRTIVDGMPGFNDFSYNYLAFYGQSFGATIDLPQAVTVNVIRVRFLDDPRHYIFPPASVKLEYSTDGTTFRPLAVQGWDSTEEHYNASTLERRIPLPSGSGVKAIRISAQPLPALPSWRPHQKKKPMLATDEVYVQ